MCCGLFWEMSSLYSQLTLSSISHQSEIKLFRWKSITARTLTNINIVSVKLNINWKYDWCIINSVIQSQCSNDWCIMSSTMTVFCSLRLYCSRTMLFIVDYNMQGPHFHWESGDKSPSHFKLSDSLLLLHSLWFGFKAKLSEENNISLSSCWNPEERRGWLLWICLTVYKQAVFLLEVVRGRDSGPSTQIWV